MRGIRRHPLPALLAWALALLPCAALDFEHYAPRVIGEDSIISAEEEQRREQKGRLKPAEDLQETAPPAPVPAAPQSREQRPQLEVPTVPMETPAEPSAFEELKPVIPGQQRPTAQEGTTFAEVAPAIPDMPEEYLSGLEQAIQPHLDVVLIDTLKGLVFVDSEQKIVGEGIVGFEGARADEALPLLNDPGFREITDKYLGQPVTLRSLNELNREVVAYYTAHDYPVVDVIVPEHDITGGVVQLVVLEGRLGMVDVAGNRWFANGLLTSQVRTESGQVLRAKKLLQDLSWLNRNPFRRVDLIYTQGQAVGTTDLILQVQDRFPIRPYVGYENSGNDATGDNRWIAGFNWGNALFLDHQLNYQYTFNNESDLFKAHTATYQAPLPWRHIATAYGGYSESTVPGDAAGLDQLSGESWSVGGRYTILLPKIETYEHEVAAGYDFKRSNSNVEFGGTTVLDQFYDVSQFSATYTSRLPDSQGATSFTGSVYYSPGDMTQYNNPEDIGAFRFGGDDEYVYARMVLERIQKLPWDFSLLARIRGQVSDDNLIISEQLGGGGYASVRGYEEGEAYGDEGFVSTLELRTPPISFRDLFKLDLPQDQLQLLLFWDYASLFLKEQSESETDGNFILSSLGAGFRYSVNPYLSVRFDYGFQMEDTGLPSRWESRGHLGIILAY